MRKKQYGLMGGGGKEGNVNPARAERNQICR